MNINVQINTDKLYRACLWWLGFVALAPLSVQAATQISPYRWQGVDRVVAFADVHGAYSELVIMLQDLEIVNEQLQWSGGATHLVSTGDLLDRGADSRKVMDLLMRLQGEAKAVGGKVHVTLGNHETMNLLGDLRYVATGEYQAFAGEEASALRKQAWEQFSAQISEKNTEVSDLRAVFDKRYPVGFLAHRAAFSPTGKYGQWLLQLPVVVVVNDTAFTHGGLPTFTAQRSLKDINQSQTTILRDYFSLRQILLEAGFIKREAVCLPYTGEAGCVVSESFSEIISNVQHVLAESTESAYSAEIIAAAKKIVAMKNAPIFNDSGPLWYRGSASCNKVIEVDGTRAALQNLDVSRVMIGHTLTRGYRAVSRMDGAVIMMDTGMSPHYKGRGTAAVIEDGGIRVYYADEKKYDIPEIEQRRIGARAGDLTDSDIETFLVSASVTSTEEIEGGSRRLLTLEQDGVKVRGVFKTEKSLNLGSRKIDRSINGRVSYFNDLAAYKLDMLLGLDVVPVTVRRTIDQEPGSLQLWVENSVTEQQRKEKGGGIASDCPLNEQYQLMNVLDMLIFNEGRKPNNILYTKRGGKLVLVDHSRSFRTRSLSAAYLKQSNLELTRELSARLKKLNASQLREIFGELIDSKQIKALLKRRDQMLKKGSARR